MTPDETIVGRVADLIEPADFYRATHGRIYQAMLDLYGRGDPLDLVAHEVMVWLNKKREQFRGR